MQTIERGGRPGGVLAVDAVGSGRPRTLLAAPGGYRFGDYWKLGLPVMVWWFVVALVVVPLVWPL